MAVENYINDELKIYRGNDFVVSKYIVLKQPTLGEICDYGEESYFDMVYGITSTPQSAKVMLFDMGIDYTKITPFQLFCMFIYNVYDQSKTSIIFGDLDFKKFEIRVNPEDESLYLEQTINNEDVVIDEYTYMMIVDYICKSHFIEQDLKVPANESTKMILIEDARDAIEKRKNSEYHSQLKNLISSMVNREGFKYNHAQVWDMKINAFMDSVKRIMKIKNSDMLLQSGYSGFGVNLKDIDDKKLDWLGELE